MKTLTATVTGIASLISTGGALAQSQMMQGGMWGGGWMGGYGGPWGAIFLIAVVAVVVVWIVQRKGK
jgi:uncharacterized membrane protein